MVVTSTTPVTSVSPKKVIIPVSYITDVPSKLMSTADTSTAFIEVSRSIPTANASKPSGTDSIVVAKLSEGDSGSLKVKILVPVAVLILLAIVIASWRYCDRGNTNQNNNTEMADVTPMMSKTATGPGAAEAEEGLLSEEV